MTPRTLIATLFLSLLFLAGGFVTTYSSAVVVDSSDVAIIGGSDGPTSVYVTDNEDPAP